MPRLQSEPCLLTDACLFGSEDEAFARHQWWVMHTKPRTEKALARRLHELERHYFLPIQEKRKLLRGRMQTSFLPLFPSYLFIFGTPEDRLLTLKTNMVVQCIEVERQKELLEDLQRVYRIIANGEALTPEDKLEPGDEVQITHGSLKGMTGIVIKRNNKLRLQIDVRMLQRGVSMEIESWMIEAIGSPRKRQLALASA
jgi:transcription antitermination factor NusG